MTTTTHQTTLPIVTDIQDDGTATMECGHTFAVDHEYVGVYQAMLHDVPEFLAGPAPIRPPTPPPSGSSVRQ